MCGVDMPKQEPQEKQEIIAAPTYADAQTQSAIASVRKNALKNSKENIKTSARGIFEAPNVQKTELSSPSSLKKTLGE